ncbi:MAG: MerR family transcriptional regulator [Acidimicrobiales bacterium]
MDGYRISEVAERTGFTPATLRYYEDIGVVPPPGRSEAGYRVYDERALGRLTFVARAKQLGLSLEEVGDLTELWDGDTCRPVQQRMGAFVTAKLTATRERIAELSALAVQLETVAARLAEEPQAGPCDETCACNAAAGAVAVPVRPGERDATPSVPIACTLASDELAGRLGDWQAVVDRAVARERLEGGARLRFRPDPGLAATLADLAQAEQSCCAFFEFAVGISADAVTLDVWAPADAEPVLAGLFGRVTGRAGTPAEGRDAMVG